MSYLCSVRKRDNKAPVTLFRKVSTGRFFLISYKSSKTFPNMKTPDIITNSEVLRRLFNGNVVTITWDEFRAILNHFGNTTKEQFNLISSDFDTVTVKLW